MLPALPSRLRSWNTTVPRTELLDVQEHLRTRFGGLAAALERCSLAPHADRLPGRRRRTRGASGAAYTFGGDNYASESGDNFTKLHSRNEEPAGAVVAGFGPVSKSWNWDTMIIGLIPRKGISPNITAPSQTPGAEGFAARRARICHRRMRSRSHLPSPQCHCVVVRPATFFVKVDRRAAGTGAPTVKMSTSDSIRPPVMNAIPRWKSRVPRLVWTVIVPVPVPTTLLG